MKKKNWYSLSGSSLDRTAYKGIPERAHSGLHSFIFKESEQFLKKGFRILDLGCGAGSWAIRLQDRGYEVTAGDSVPPGQPIPNFVSINLNNSFAQQVGKTEYDVVSCVEVLEHIENPRNLLRNVRELLKPGGKFIFTTPNASGLYSRVKFFFTGRFAMFDDQHYEGIGHIRPLTFWEIEKILLENQFKIAHLSFFDITPMIPKTVGDLIKRLSWGLRPLMSGVVGTMNILVVAEKQ